MGRSFPFEDTATKRIPTASAGRQKTAGEQVNARIVYVSHHAAFEGRNTARPALPAPASSAVTGDIAVQSPVNLDK